ncbi:MAG TPA: hypothetical protein VL652_20870 [Kutzneria sp.]|nr:hypothetical protein [Kutzneria sp.]
MTRVTQRRRDGREHLVMTTKKLTLALAATAAIGALAVGGAVAFAAAPGTATGTATQATQAATGDAKIMLECLAANEVGNRGAWRPGARLNTDATHGFLVIRTDKNAAVCVVENDHGTGLMGGVIDNHDYGKLTAQRPFDYLTSMNYPHQSVHFGISTSDVTGVSLVGPDGKSAAATVKDGTFAVLAKAGENSNEPTTNHIRATLANGQTVDGPFRG